MIKEGVLSLQNVVVFTYMEMVENLAKYNLYTKICSNVEQLKYILMVLLVMPI